MHFKNYIQFKPKNCIKYLEIDFQRDCIYIPLNTCHSLMLKIFNILANLMTEKWHCVINGIVHVLIYCKSSGAPFYGFTALLAFLSHETYMTSAHSCTGGLSFSY